MMEDANMTPDELAQLLIELPAILDALQSEYESQLQQK
ncbi:hypothetical protein P22_1101 [Propionispora sp. 2/2-37]|nr:hypothetical protein P22_1101 [Propionispora sp. 2/2-37]